MNAILQMTFTSGTNTQKCRYINTNFNEVSYLGFNGHYSELVGYFVSTITWINIEHVPTRHFASQKHSEWCHAFLLYMKIFNLILTSGNILVINVTITITLLYIMYNGICSRWKVVANILIVTYASFFSLFQSNKNTLNVSQETHLP